MRRANGQGTVAILLVARSLIEGVLFAGAFTVAQVALTGDRAVPMVATVLALTGVEIILASVLRDARADRQNTAIALAAMGAAAALGVWSAPPHPDGLMILSRIVLFGIIGEAFVWRDLSIARSVARWTDTRNAGFAAIAIVALSALLPGAVDHAGLVVAGLVATVATGIGLSLARSAEELQLAGREARGGTGRGTASGTAILLALLSIVGAVAAPFTGELLRGAGEAIAPAIGGLLYGVLLVLGYVAELFVNFFRALFNGFRFPPLRQLTPPLTRSEEEEAIRQIEASRPFVMGALEIVIAAVALLVVVILVDRMARERREQLPDGAKLDRETAAGEGLGAFLSGLLPKRRRAPAAPRDDGTAAGALRALYWRYLSRGAAHGVAWRGVGETPAEHHQRALRLVPGHAAAGVLVRAFEDLRYGERDPDEATLSASRSAVAALDEP